MPYLNHPSIRHLIRAIPIADHSVAVDAAFWRPLCEAAGRTTEHDALFAGQSTIHISRQWLLRAPGVAPHIRCLAILLWGYPSGGRGNIHKGWLQNLSQITNAASAPGMIWPDYYAQLHGIGGLGISTITKLATFWNQRFSGHEAVVLDQRILRLLASRRWEELAHLRHLTYPLAHHHYVDYLATMADIADAGDMSVKQLEFFLFALGESF